MKIKDILDIELENKKEIHLFKFGNFWDIYERSAYYFINNIFQYELHHRKIASRHLDIVFVCFPDSNLKKILKICADNYYEIYNLNEKHIIIKKIPIIQGFKNWKENYIKYDKKDNTLPNTNIIYNKLYLFKGVFEFSKYILKLVSNFNKSYKFSFGERLTNEILDISEISYLYANGINNINVSKLQKQLMLLRFHIRLSNELHQISSKQYLYASEVIETILKYFTENNVIKV